MYLEYSVDIWLDKPENPLKPIDMEHFHYSTALHALGDTQGDTQGMVLVLVQVFYNIHVPVFIVISYR